MSFWNDPLKVAADWLEGLLTGWGLDAVFAHVLVAFLGVFLLIALLMVLDIFLVWIERKVVARFQDRVGPNRVGPFGLIQPFADIIKLIIKEDTTPGGADKVVYNLAPILSMMSVLILWAVVPLAPVVRSSVISNTSRKGIRKVPGASPAPFFGGIGPFRGQVPEESRPPWRSSSSEGRGRPRPNDPAAILVA